MPRLNWARFDAAALRLFARFGPGAEAFFVRYLQGVRWEELLKLTGGLFGTALWFGETMRFPTWLTFTFAYVIATIFALGYLRVPKHDDAGDTGGAAPGPGAESEASDGSESQNSAPTGP